MGPEGGLESGDRNGTGTEDASASASASSGDVADGDDDRPTSQKGRASGSATSARNNDTSEAEAKAIGDGRDADADDLPPTVEILTSAVTGLVPFTVEVTIQVRDPEREDTELHYDMGLGDDGGGGTGAVMIEGAGSLSLTVEYAEADTYTISARADDGRSVTHVSRSITALSGCPDDGSLVLLDDPNNDSPADGWEATCMTAHRDADAEPQTLHVIIHFVPGRNVTDPDSLEPPTGFLHYSEDKGLSHNKNKLELEGGEPSVVWSRKTITWQEDPDTSAEAIWEDQCLTVIMSLADLEDGGESMETDDVLQAIHFVGTAGNESLGSADEGASLRFTEDDIEPVE